MLWILWGLGHDKETFPKKLLSFLTVVGLFMVAMAIALAGSTLMPL